MKNNKILVKSKSKKYPIYIGNGNISIIKKLFETSPQMTSKGMFGNKEEVDDLKHLMGVYLGWGGLKEEYVLYESRFVEDNNGKTNYQLNFGKVPIDAFWSVIVYDNNGLIYEKGNNSLNNFSEVDEFETVNAILVAIQISSKIPSDKFVENLMKLAVLDKNMKIRDLALKTLDKTYNRKI